MKTAAMALLCILVLLPTAAFADSITSVSPSSFNQGDIEQFTVVTGSGLTGSVSTQVTLSGPGGSFTSGASGSDTLLYVSIPDFILSVPGRVSITVVAADGVGTRTIGPAYFDVIARVGQQPPLLFIPETIIVEATSASGTSVTFDASGVSFVDPVPSVVCDHASGALYPVGSTTVHCTATDSFGSTSGAFEINVTDTQAPVLQVPATIFSNNPVVTFTVTATDNVDANPLVVCSPAAGSTFGIGTTTVNCRSQDSHANTGAASFRVTVTGGVGAPVLSLPDDIVAEASNPAGTAVMFAATASDASPVTCSPASGSAFARGVTTVSCSASSSGGTSSDSFTVTVVDTQPPVLTLPAPITASATSASGAAVTFTATASDLGDGPVPITCFPPSGSTFPMGTTKVVCIAADASFNARDGSFTVTVQAADTTPPVLSLPAAITKEATSAAGATVTFVVSAIDAVDGAVPVTCDHLSGATFPLGTTTVQCSAMDAHHNTASGVFLVTVRDTTPPVLSLPATFTAEATSASGAAVSYSATATDIVDGSVAVHCDHASGSTFPLGTTPVQCNATDAHNNTSYGSFSVVVRDTTPPNIVRIDATPSVLWPPSHKLESVSITVIASDAVDASPTSHIISVTSNQAANGNGDGNTATDWVITGPLTLQVRSERTGSTDRIYTITIATTDASGNTTHGTVIVSVSNTRGRAAAH